MLLYSSVVAYRRAALPTGGGRGRSGRGGRQAPPTERERGSTAGRREQALRGRNEIRPVVGRIGFRGLAFKHYITMMFFRIGSVRLSLCVQASLVLRTTHTS